MNIPEQIAKQFRDLYFGGNWTFVNMKDTLADVDWKLATTPVDSLNTIAKLVYHTNYYVHAVLHVLQGEKLTASDKYSFDVPVITSEEEWQRLLNKSLEEAELFATAIAQFPESRLQETFFEDKYGNYYRNLHGIIEHTHYHLGQIVVIKKLLKQS